MVNASLNWASIVGIVLAVGGVLLYALRTIKPALSRDYDVFFSAVGLLCGGILLFQGWRLDPILQVGQFLLAATTVFFAYESVRLRGVTTEQARRNEMLDEPDDVPFRAPMGYGLDEQRGDQDRFEWREPLRRRIRGTGEAEEHPDPYRMARPSRVAIPERSSGRRADTPSPSYRQRQRGTGDGYGDQFEPQDPRDADSSGWENNWNSDVSRPTNDRQTRYGRPSAGGRRDFPSRAQPREPGEAFGARRQQRESRLSQRRGTPTDAQGRERPLLPRRRATRGSQQQPEPFDQDPRLAAATSRPRSAQPPAGEPMAAKRPRSSNQSSGTPPAQRSSSGSPGGMTDATFSPVTNRTADPRNSPRGARPPANPGIEQDNSARFDD